MSVSAVTSASNYGSIAFDQESLTPEGMMLYLSTRMEEVDGEINKLFDKQKASQDIRKALGEIQNELGKLKDDDGLLTMPGSEVEQNINTAIAKIGEIDPQLAEKMWTDMNKEGQILYVQDSKYYAQEVTASKSYIENIIKDLDATAQMDMIRLQSHMSARQTAIQLSTNLIASISDSLKAVVSNFR